MKPTCSIYDIHHSVNNILLLQFLMETFSERNLEAVRTTNAMLLLILQMLVSWLSCLPSCFSTLCPLPRAGIQIWTSNEHEYLFQTVDLKDH